MRKNRFILMNGENKIGEAPSIREFSKLLGCSFQNIYQNLNEDKTQFNFKKITYTIVDKLS